MRELAHVLNPLAADLSGEHRAEPVPPEPDGLMADVDAPLEQEVFDVSEGDWVSDLHRDDEPDDFQRAVERAKRVRGFGRA